MRICSGIKSEIIKMIYLISMEDVYMVIYYDNRFDTIVLESTS